MNWFKIVFLLFIISNGVLYSGTNNKKDNNNVKKDVNKKQFVEKIPVLAITYFEFGTHGKPLIEVYITPSCLHCAQFLVEDLKKFLDKHKQECQVKLVLLPYKAKDFFIMKIIQASVTNETEYYRVFYNYITRALFTLDKIKPSKEQIEMYKGSNTDPEMIKFQVLAHDFQFTDEEIINATPNMNEFYERGLVQHYDEISTKLEKITNKKSLDLPLITCHGETYQTLNDALEACNKNNKNTPN